MKNQIGLFQVSVLAISLAVIPNTAHAYLDPGSGNALISLLVVALGSLGYICQTIWYRVRHLIPLKRFSATRDEATLSKWGHKHDLAIFSEGKNYHSTFEPIIKELIAQEQSVFYVTFGVDDPILLFNHPLFNASYLGDGALGFARLRRVRAKIMLATTPNIGAPGFPLLRPERVDKLVHVCHAVSGLGNYQRHSLDSYDTVLMPGDFMLGEVREIERMRNLPNKECVSVGLPYLDCLAANATIKTNSSGRPVILIAPSWGSKNFLKMCRPDLLCAIAKGNYEVIIRPHPHSWLVEASFFEQIAIDLARYSNVSIDRAIDASESLSRADLLISGRSAVRFDFAFIYEKPVLSVRLPLEDTDEYEFNDLGEIWEDQAQYLLGPVIEPHTDTEDIIGKIEEALSFNPSEIATLRQTTVASIGQSSERIVNWCLSQVREA